MRGAKAHAIRYIRSIAIKANSEISAYDHFMAIDCMCAKGMEELKMIQVSIASQRLAWHKQSEKKIAKKIFDDYEPYIRNQVQCRKEPEDITRTFMLQQPVRRLLRLNEL